MKQRRLLSLLTALVLVLMLLPVAALAEDLTVPVASVRIEGDAVEGATLTAKAVGAGEEAPTNLTYTWQAEGADGVYSDLSGTGEDFFTIPDDGSLLGKKLRVTATGDEGSSATSEPTEAIVVKTSVRLEADKLALSLGVDEDLKEAMKLTLPTAGDNGSAITWVSSSPLLDATTGDVRMPTAGKVSVTLTANLELKGEQDSKNFLFTLYSKAAASAATLPDLAADWSSFRGDDDNNAVTTAKTPTEQALSELSWTHKLKDFEDWQTALSDPVLVDDHVYVAVGAELWKLSRDGELVARGALSEPIGNTCRLLYAEGRILVPLSKGKLEALAAGSLESLWCTDEIITGGEAHQSLTTLTYADGKVYRGTAQADWTATYAGFYQCFAVSDGQLIWEYDAGSSGFYWSGAAVTGNAVVFGGDDGKLISHDKTQETVLDTVTVSAGIRSTVVYHDGAVYFSTVDGTFHKVVLNANGTFGAASSVRFAASSTSTPAVYNGKAYVGGSLGAAGNYEGVMAVIDLSSMQVVDKVTAPAEVKASPLVSTGYAGKVYVYFTANTEPGGLYLYEDSGAARAVNPAQPLFVPEGDDANYCMTSVMADAQGRLYYINDSGKLFVLAPKQQSEQAQTFEIKLNCGKGGHVSVEGGNKVRKGERAVLLFTPDSGYVLGSVLIDGAAVNVKNNRYTIEHVQADHTVTVRFVKTAGQGTNSTDDAGSKQTQTGESSAALHYILLILAASALVIVFMIVRKNRKNAAS